MPIHIVYILACVCVGALGKNTLLGFWGFFTLSLIFSPAIGIIIVVIGKSKE